MPNSNYVGVTNRTGGSVSGMYRRTDGSGTWKFFDALTGTHVHAIAVHPEDRAVVYAATSKGLLRSNDRGESWTDLSDDLVTLSLRPHLASAILTLFARIADSSRGEAGRLYRSTDTGATWAQIDHGVSVNSTMMGVALNPDDPDRIHCVAREGQSISTDDSGASWQELPLPQGAGAAVAIACG